MCRFDRKKEVGSEFRLSLGHDLTGLFQHLHQQAIVRASRILADHKISTDQATYLNKSNENTTKGV
jgi:hypothetical protein